MRCPRCYAPCDGEACSGCGKVLGRKLAEEGMVQAVEAADVDWVASAEAAVDRLIASGKEFTTDDVWAVTGPCPSGDPRALGAIIRSRSKRKLIVRAGLRESTRAACHARPVTVWRPA